MVAFANCQSTFAQINPQLIPTLEMIFEILPGKYGTQNSTYYHLVSKLNMVRKICS